ncbi:MAG: hypothetical protein H6R21_2033 [Proteobacteria bacterium]|nr:hypothetical protein [Pseudomonadota bacterium]
MVTVVVSMACSCFSVTQKPISKAIVISTRHSAAVIGPMAVSAPRTAHRFLAAFYALFLRRYQPSRQQEQRDRRHGIVQRFGQPDDHCEGEYRQNPLSGYGESVRQGHQCNRQGYDHGDHYGDRERFGGRC